METLLMSESLVDSPDVEETVTQVLTKLVQDGEDEDQMSVEFLQEQVELRLEYSEGSLRKWQNFLGNRLSIRLRDSFLNLTPL